MKKSLSIALGYLLFAIIGVPMALAGMASGKSTLKLAWTRSAHAFGCDLTGALPEPVEVHSATQSDFVQLQKGEYEPSEACKQVFIDKHLLNVYLRGGSITRVLKVPADPLPWQRSREGSAYSRVVLKPLSQEFMNKQGMEFTLDGAIAFTRSEIGSGRIDRARERGAAVREVTSESSKSLYPPSSPQPTAVDELGTQDLNLPKKTGRGEVVFAGENRITPQGRAPYETFSVILKGVDGERLTFSGVDLREQFAEGKFALGDHVSITQVRSRISSEIGGKAVVTNKNLHVIEPIA